MFKAKAMDIKEQVRQGNLGKSEDHEKRKRKTGQGNRPQAPRRTSQTLKNREEMKQTQKTVSFT